MKHYLENKSVSWITFYFKQISQGNAPNRIINGTNGYDSIPPLAYSITRQSVFSVSMTSKSFTEMNHINPEFLRQTSKHNLPVLSNNYFFIYKTLIFCVFTSSKFLKINCKLFLLGTSAVQRSEVTVTGIQQHNNELWACYSVLHWSLLISL